MALSSDATSQAPGSLRRLTEGWGSRAAVTLYLDRCQVDTPDALVTEVWAQVLARRRRIATAIDFGAGDGRFAIGGRYQQYVGYEIDHARCAAASLPNRAVLLNKCAFADERFDADVCIGNPPYVRNQDLPRGWRERASSSLTARTGVALSGLANAWQYFFLLSLASTKCDGLVAIVIPYEWVSRPSSCALRNFISDKKWDVSVYRLQDSTFAPVLTTSSITVVDKRGCKGRWQFFEQLLSGGYRVLASESGGRSGVVAYAKRSATSASKMLAKRGLSPGTQDVLVLTEGERVRSGLRARADVVPCVTSLRMLDAACASLTERLFNERLRFAGRKCWLVRTDSEPSPRLARYFASIHADRYQTTTCLERERWWQFAMPEVPALLAATGFCGRRPKVVVNTIGARAIGSVSGIYGVPKTASHALARRLATLDLSRRIVPHSNGLKKLEINQLNTLLRAIQQRRR